MTDGVVLPFKKKYQKNNNINKSYRFKALKFYKAELLKSAGHILPLPRSGHRSVADDGNLYSFGGYNPHEVIEDDDAAGERSLFRELWKYNFATKRWMKLKTHGYMPKELASHCALLSGNSLLVYGGTGVPFGYMSSNTLHVCNLKTMTWQEVQTTGRPPERLYGQAMVLIDEMLYVYGGTTGFDYSSDVYRLNLTSCHWEELAAKQKPAARYRHEIATDGHRLYIFGGGTSDTCFEFSDLPVFDIDARQWAHVKTLPDATSGKRKALGTTDEGFPCPRRCHSLVQKGNLVFVCGGYDGSRIFPDVWRFDLVGHQWTRLHCKLPKAVYFHSSALTTSGCMYVFGGVTHITQTSRTADVYAVWLDVPSLREMCWEAVGRYVPHIQNVTHDDALEMGMPADLLDRIDRSAMPAAVS